MPVSAKFFDRPAYRFKRGHPVALSGTIRRHFETRQVSNLANNPEQSWGFEGEPPEAVTKDFGTEMRLHEDASFSCI
jgi:hypothetical protein